MVTLDEAAKILAGQFRGYSPTLVRERKIILTRVTKPNPILRTLHIMALAPLILLGGSYQLVTSQGNEIHIIPNELFKQTRVALPKSVQHDHLRGEIRIYSAGRLIVIASREGKLTAFER